MTSKLHRLTMWYQPRVVWVKGEAGPRTVDSLGTGKILEWKPSPYDWITQWKGTVREDWRIVAWHTIEAEDTWESSGVYK